MSQPEPHSWNDRDGIPTLMPDAAQPGTPGPGVMIGNFELQTVLGRGGMGEVWKAWDTEGDRPVVIKLVPPELQRADEEMARVRETFKRVHALQHQHICPLYLLSKDPRFGWYLVMKYIDGQTLSAYRATYVARHGSFPVQQVVKVLRPVAEALDYAHRNKVIHRDIKPKNILVVGDAEDVQVVDFGLAAEIRTTVSRYTRVQMDTSGTRPYMAPEQWKGQIQDAATDQYALAATAYELLAGHLPFESDDFDILRASVLNDPPEALEDQSSAINRALALGLAKGRDERFGTCCEFVQALGSSTPVQTPRPAVRPIVEDDPRKPCPSCGQILRLGPKTAGKELPCPGCKATLQISADRQQVTKKATRKITNSMGIKMILVPAGEFLMGSANRDSRARSDEKPQHRVRISQPFYLGVYPVTQAEYQRVMDKNPSRFRGDERRPVEMVSWKEAQEFCRRLSVAEQVTYRLPTEAEWEYACRAGSTGRWCFGDDESLLKQYAWYSENSGDAIHPVGKKNANAWGVYDMHGNVWEWCLDWYAANYYEEFSSKLAVDPLGATGGSRRVFRGGGWYCDASATRASCRNCDVPKQRLDYRGFRLARTVS